MSVFSNLKVYGGKWSVKSERPFTQEEQDAVLKIRVVDSDYGMSACFTMFSGGDIYIPMSNDSDVHIGDSLDITTISLLTLEKQGENDILRVKA